MANTVDEILIEDAMYVKAFDDDTIPDTETLSLMYLSDRVHLAYDDCWSSQTKWIFAHCEWETKCLFMFH